MMVNDPVYSVHIGNSPGWLMFFSPMMIVADRSRSLIVAKSLRYLTGIFTVFSKSELSNAMVTVMV